MASGTTEILQHLTHYGETALEDEDYTGPVPVNFTFNSPVGLCMDHHQQIWGCDTGNNRFVIFNHRLTHILRILHCPAPGGSGKGTIGFRLPFHLCPHPDKKLMYITDMGNARVVTIKYGDNSFAFDAAFGKGFMQKTGCHKKPSTRPDNPESPHRSAWGKADSAGEIANWRQRVCPAR